MFKLLKEDSKAAKGIEMANKTRLICNSLLPGLSIMARPNPVKQRYPPATIEKFLEKAGDTSEGNIVVEEAPNYPDSLQTPRDLVFLALLSPNNVLRNPQ